MPFLGRAEPRRSLIASGIVACAGTDSRDVLCAVSELGAENGAGERRRRSLLCRWRHDLSTGLRGDGCAGEVARDRAWVTFLCMADQSSAADEYALLREITAPLTMLPDDPVAIAADVDFSVVLRGYDRVAVDAYVKRTRQLVAELDATRLPEAAIRRAFEPMGEQISGILQSAHDTAGQMIARSRVEAEDRLEVSRHEAAQIAAAGEQQRRDLDADSDRIWAERRRIVEDARGLAGQLIALAEAAAERFPPAGPQVTAEPEVGAEPDAVAELRGAAAGRASDHDVTALLPPVGPARDASPPKDE
jgi:hypothetical protein